MSDKHLRELERRRRMSIDDPIETLCRAVTAGLQHGTPINEYLGDIAANKEQPAVKTLLATTGSICLHSDGILISGDTLFSNTIGRTDFAGSDPHHMKQSLLRLGALRPHTLLPGHADILLNTPERIQETIQHWTRQLNT